jgi:hypothetical protein
MKKVILSLLLISLLISCEKKSSDLLTTNSTSDSLVIISATSEPIESSTLQTCYLQATGKDSVFVSLEDNLGTITGKMRYKNFEKDSSFGDVIGSQNGDTLKLNYTFEAEGKTSEREIYFLRKADNIMEGIGDQKTEGDKSNYADLTKIKYEGITLKQVDCTDFGTKFKIK